MLAESARLKTSWQSKGKLGDERMKDMERREGRKEKNRGRSEKLIVRAGKKWKSGRKCCKRKGKGVVSSTRPFSHSSAPGDHISLFLSSLFLSLSLSSLSLSVRIPYHLIITFPFPFHLPTPDCSYSRMDSLIGLEVGCDWR